MQLDFLQIFANIPWWVYPLVILMAILKPYQPKKRIRNKYESNSNKRNKTEIKYKEYKPINKINSDRGNLYNTITPNKKNYCDMYKKTKKKNNINSKQKGDEYEAHISNHFKRLGYKTVEHGKMHGVKDQGIDLMLKKGKEFIFVQCKDWNIENKERIDSKEIQYTRMNVKDYIENKQALFDMYDWKILYVTSDEILDKSAKYKIREFSHEIEHQVIAI